MGVLIEIKTNTSQEANAITIAKTLLKRKVASAINITAIQSWYNWEGELTNKKEFSLLIKTTEDKYAIACATIKELHMYEKPSIYYIKTDGCDAGYSQWINNELEYEDRNKQTEKDYLLKSKYKVGDNIKEDFANCHGNEYKKQLINAYVIKPIRWARLLNGQTVHGCCIDTEITDIYYEFEALAKKGTAASTRFHVGKHCAKQFLDLIEWGDKIIVGFDPYAKKINEDMTELNREVWCALNLIMISMKIIKLDRSALQRTVEFISKYYNKDTEVWSVKSLNEFLCRNKMSLDGMVEKIIKTDKSFPNYQFPLLKKLL